MLFASITGCGVDFKIDLFEQYQFWIIGHTLYSENFKHSVLLNNLRTRDPGVKQGPAFSYATTSEVRAYNSVGVPLYQFDTPTLYHKPREIYNLTAAKM